MQKQDVLLGKPAVFCFLPLPPPGFDSSWEVHKVGSPPPPLVPPTNLPHFFFCHDGRVPGVLLSPSSPSHFRLLFRLLFGWLESPINRKGTLSSRRLRRRRRSGSTYPFFFLGLLYASMLPGVYISRFCPRSSPKISPEVVSAGQILLSARPLPLLPSPQPFFTGGFPFN